jgi:hypothetical protein
MSDRGERMFIQYGVRLLGVTYVVLGLLGFVPFEAVNPVHHEGVGAHYLLHLVAINGMHNLIHLGIGLFGVWAGGSLARCRAWGIVTGVVLLCVFTVGMVQAALDGYPVDQLLLGLVPLNPPGHMLHLATGAVALYLGLARAPASITRE